MFKHAFFSTAALAFLLGACSGSTTSSPSSGGGAGGVTLSEEAKTVAAAGTAMGSAAGNANGVLNGSGLSLVSIQAMDPETDCSTGGWPVDSSMDPGYPVKFAYCSMRKRPDGPDTLRGGIDRVTGFLCAVGAPTYDGNAKNITLTISTACFSANFVSAACSGASSCTAAAVVKADDDVTGVGPADFQKYVHISIPFYTLDYTILFKTSATERSFALKEGAPSSTDATTEDTFAVSMNRTTGTLNFEGRFIRAAGKLRHIRAKLIGTMNSDFDFTDVQTIQFLHGEANTSGTTGWLISMSGTPADGRRVRYMNSADVTVASPVLTGTTDDDTCIGEVGALCTGNTGIDSAAGSYFGSTGATGHQTWFSTNSYLMGAGNVDGDEIWN